MEEEAVISYTHYLKEVEEGRLENIPAPLIAKEYWGLSEDSNLIDVIYAVRKDECKHRDVNHHFANSLDTKT